ncbi:hypothetical protein LCGC14_0730380 [marine sediment metagenome]|uniref:BioF2-like acetyltransferase domain-containing protein n=1 Tax=marine sediment metagenome TaxID=412755 RepID=A0A0F9Q9S5_9ZZZZ
MKLNAYTALYSSLDVEYSQAMSGPYEDLSFHDDDCKVIAGLKDNRISGFWRPMVATGGDKALKLHIERLYDICPHITYLDFLIDGRLSVISQFLLRHGHTARPYYTQIIDLTRSVEDLHCGLRKSYKSLVNKTDVWNIVKVPEYRQMCETIKGPRRSDRTWEIQHRMKPLCLTDGKAGAMFYCNKPAAYYASAAGENNHTAIYMAMGLLKNSGYKFLEMGEQIFAGDLKLVNISKYKRGFGGQTITRLILEK